MKNINEDIETESKDIICAILVGKASDSQKAERMVKASQACPYVALYTARDNMILGVFTLPRSEQQWIEYPQEKPMFLDLDQVMMTVFTDQVQATSPWSQGEVRPEGTETPCKKRCDQCARYPDQCRGCPATIYYLASE